MSKKLLTKRILCSVLAAGAFGVIYNPIADAATVNGEQLKPDENGVVTVTDEKLIDAGSKKFIFGQGDSIHIKTEGNVNQLISDIKKGDIRKALADNAVVGVIGGEGQLDSGLTDTLDFINPFIDNIGLTSEQKELIKKIQSIDTVKSNSADIQGDTNVIIGGENISPAVIGAVGGDLSINTGTNLTVNTNFIPMYFTSKETSITRNGNVNMSINSGNVIGGIGGSTAITTGNIEGNFNINKKVSIITIKDVNLELDGKTTTTINGNVNVNINNGANVAGFTGGGMAMAIGGEATSDVNGDVKINIDSKVDLNDKFDGITAGIAGGGTAVTTIGGKATTTTGNTNININNGLSAGIIGGGIATAIDATGVAEAVIDPNKQYGNDAGYVDITDKQLEKLLGMSSGIPDGTIVINDAVQGGTATAITGDTNISLTGNTSAAGIIGGGMAVASHTYTWKGDNTAKGEYKVNDSFGTSIATADTGKTNITINVDSSKMTGEQKSKILTALKGLKDTQNLDSIKDVLKEIQGTGAVVGVTGGGISIAQGSSRSNMEGTSGNWGEGENPQGAYATSKNKGADINLVNGYVVGTFGGGIASATNNAKATSETTGDININIGNGTEAVGVFGNGLAYFTGSSDGGTKNLAGSANVIAGNSTINVGMNFADTEGLDKTTKVDGILGGGIAIDDSQADRINASVKTNGKATINVFDGAEVNKMNLDALKALTGEAQTDSSKPMDMGNYLASVQDAAGNVAIAGGGVAIGGGAESYVKDAEINIYGGKVNGDIIGGGVATYGYAGKDGQANGGSTVDNATINLYGGIIDGNVYAGGAASNYEYNKKGYTTAQSTVNKATINWAGSEITGVISGNGYKIDENKKQQAVDVVDSTLNVIGENTLTLVNGASKINGFDKVNFAENSVTKVDGSLKSGNSTALIDLDGAVVDQEGKATDGTITVADSARLDISALSKDNGQNYYIAGNYNIDTSKLWDNDQLAYDRTEGYAKAIEDNGKYEISYKGLSELTDEEKNQAVEDAVSSFGFFGKNARGIIDGIIKDSDDTNEGAKDLVGDLTSADSKSAAEAGLYNAIMLGEDSGVTSNAISMAQDFADNAVLRLSFTQDNLSKAKLGDEGAVWAKYLHNKHELDDMGSSFGALNSSNSYDGIIVGTDFAKTGKVQSGIAFAYGDGDGHGMTTENDFDMWGLTLYGNIKNDDTNIIGDIGYSRSSNDIKSKILGNDFNTDRDLDIFTMGVRAEKLYTKGNTQIVPYTGLRYMSVNPDDYSTSYKGQNAFNYSADRQNIWTVPLGLSFRNETVTKNGWSITPKVDLAYIWAFGDTDNSLTVNAGSGYDVLDYTVMDDGSFLGSIGLDFNKDAWTYGLGYTYQKGSHAENNRWFVNVDYNF